MRQERLRTPGLSHWKISIDDKRSMKTLPRIKWLDYLKSIFCFDEKKILGKESFLFHHRWLTCFSICVSFFEYVTLIDDSNVNKISNTGGTCFVFICNSANLLLKICVFLTWPYIYMFLAHIQHIFGLHITRRICNEMSKLGRQSYNNLLFNSW